MQYVMYFRLWMTSCFSHVRPGRGDAIERVSLLVLSHSPGESPGRTVMSTTILFTVDSAINRVRTDPGKVWKVVIFSRH